MAGSKGLSASQKKALLGIPLGPFQTQYSNFHWRTISSLIQAGHINGMDSQARTIGRHDMVCITAKGLRARANLVAESKPPD